MKKRKERKKKCLGSLGEGGRRFVFVSQLFSTMIFKLKHFWDNKYASITYEASDFTESEIEEIELALIAVTLHRVGAAVPCYEKLHSAVRDVVLFNGQATTKYINGELLSAMDEIKKKQCDRLFELVKAKRRK